MLPHARMLLGQLRRLAPSAADAALLARWLNQRDEDAFAALVARHGPMVLGVCRRVLGDAQHAEDAFQATFLVLARRAAHLRKPEALASFLHGTALRLASKARQATRRRELPAIDGLPEPTDPHPDPLDLLSGRELLALLDEEVDRLPERYRLPVLLCVLQERTVEEAAGLLGWGLGSVRGRLARGRERLRQRLARRGICLSAGGVALLGSAALPERLLAASVCNLTGPVAAEVSALAGGASAALKPLAVGLGLFVLVTVGLGAGLAVHRPPAPEASAAPHPAAPPVPAAAEPRRDRFGDPLPAGAIARLGTTRFRAYEICSLAFSPDGRNLAASSRGGLYLFDAASGKRLRRLHGPEHGLSIHNPIVFSPDGRHLAGMARNMADPPGQVVVRIWDVVGSRQPRKYVVKDAVWIGWSPDGEPLAACLETGALCLHELATGRLRRFPCKDLGPELAGITACAASLGGRTLAISDKRGVVHVWDTATGLERCTCRPKGRHPRYLALSPDGSRLVSVSSQAVQGWEVGTAKEVYALDTKDKYTYGLALSRDGKTLAVIDSWWAIRFLDPATGRERGHTEEKYHCYENSLALSPDGRTLATVPGFIAAAIHLWDVPAGKRKAAPEGAWFGPRGLSISPDGRRVAVSAWDEGKIYIWSADNAELVTSVHRPGGIAGDCAFSRDGRSLWCCWINDNVWGFDATSGERQHVLTLDDPEWMNCRQLGQTLHLSDDGKTLIAFSRYYPKAKGVACPQEALITGWDTATRRQLFRRRFPGNTTWYAVSADARVLALSHPAGSLDGAPGRGPMRLEDVATGEHLLNFPALEGQTWPLAFSPDGRLLASKTCKLEDKAGKPELVFTYRLWETVTATEVLALPAAENDRVAFSPDGRLLALAAPGQEILVWDLECSRERRRWKGIDSDVTQLAFSPDGRRLVSGLADSSLLVWDVVPRPAASEKLGAEALMKAWADLGAADAPRAFRARWRLTTSAEEALSLLKERLHPAREVDAQRLRRLLADLESSEFAVREKAQEEIAKLGDLAEAALRQALSGKPTPELRRRVKTLLDGLQGPVTNPEVLRGLRAVAVLEGIGTRAARRLLEELAAGAAGARLTREAKAALHRLDLRSPTDR